MTRRRNTGDQKPEEGQKPKEETPAEERTDRHADADAAPDQAETAKPETAKPGERTDGEPGTSPGDGPGPVTAETSDQDARKDGAQADDAREPAPARRGGGRAFLLFLAFLLALGGGALGSYPWWRDHVPDPYRAWLPAPPAPALSGEVSSLRADLDEARAEVARLARVVEMGQDESDPAFPALEDSLEALAGRLDRVEAALAEVGTREPGTAPVPPEVETRLETLERGLGDMERLREELADADTVMRLAQRLDETERRMESLAAGRGEAQALLLAVGLWREAVLRGGGFQDELETVRELAGDDETVLRLTEPLLPFAARGVASMDALRRDFSDAAASALQAEAVPETADWLQKTIARLGSVVRIRRIDAEAQGDDVSAVLARAGARLEARDLAGAVAEVSALDGEAGRVMAPWLARAEARLLTEDAMAVLSARALALGAGERSGEDGR